jgi:hypothetical protein
VPIIVNRFARLHRCLQFLDDVALLDQIVLHLDAGDSLERLCECLRFILMRRDGLGDDTDLLDALSLELIRRTDEPLHFGKLLLLGKRGGLKLLLNPFLGGGFVGERRSRNGKRDGRERRGDSELEFHWSPKD